MKTFYATLAVFALMLGLIVWNACHIHQTANELTAQLDAMPQCEQSLAALDALSAYWEKERRVLALSTAFEDIAALDDCITEMRTAAALGEEAEYIKSRAIAYNIIARIRRIEQCSLDSVL